MEVGVGSQPIRETKRDSGTRLRIIFLLIILVNAALIAYGIVYENISREKQAVLGAISGVFVVLGLIATFFDRKYLRFLREIQVTLFFVLVAAICIDVTYRLAPGLFPLALRNLMQDMPVAEQRVRVVEYLPYSPYAKPKPNVVVKIPAYHGSPNDFVYEWRTDSRGFKNLPELAARPTIPIVAIGDSFTEGMGVLTEQTWASQLTALGFSTYSLGVQGYAPTQMAGAFMHWGLPLKPQYVLIGYLTHVSERERYFAVPIDVDKPEALPSAIQRLVDEDRALARRINLDIPEPPQEIREQYRFAASAAIALGVRLWREWGVKIPADTRGIPDPDNDPRYMPSERLVADSTIKIGAMQRYRAEIFDVAFKWKLDIEAARNRPTWRSTLDRFTEVASAAKKAGAYPIIVMFYNRGYRYAEHATGMKLDPSNSNDVEASLMREFAEREGIGFIDTKASFDKAIRDITDSTPLSRYPYLRIDAHPSPFGHQLVAGQIADYLRARGHREMR